MIPNSENLLQDITGYSDPANWVGSLSNISAAIMSQVPSLNWVGFYIWNGKKLILGPFQGAPACTEIQWGRGVCGRAAQEQKTYRVDNVHLFEDHITCDVRSQSELVVPLIQSGKLIGVLDIDSPQLNRFSLEDQLLFEEVAEVIVSKLQFGGE